jgi:hypothetical protein
MKYRTQGGKKSRKLSVELATTRGKTYLGKDMPKVNGQALEDTRTPEHEMQIRILTALRDAWVTCMKDEGTDPVVFMRMSVIAMTQLSAIMGVDAGMDVDRFVSVCRAQFEIAYKNAPRFG